ncbi:MAG: ABC transporter substrate-binding protein [Chloroflexota bacterium]
MKKVWRVFFFLWLVLGLSGCQLELDDLSPDQVFVGQTNPNGKVVIGLAGDIDSLNPLTNLDRTLSFISPLLYAPLNQVDPQTALLNPGMATTNISTDEKILQLTFLRESWLQDAQASIENATWPSFVNIQAVRKNSNNQLRVEMKEIDCFFADRLVQLPILTSETVLDRVPQGYGPFMVEFWDEEAGLLELIPNPLSIQKQPKLAGITIRIFASTTMAEAALQAGEIDLLPFAAPLQSPPEDMQRLDYLAPQRILFLMNTSDPVLEAVSVRQALRLAIDRKSLVAGGLQKEAILMTGMLPANHWAAANEMPPSDYDPEQAKRLLDEQDIIDRDGDGWRDLSGGETWYLPIRVQNNEEAQTALAFILADAFQQVGIQARAELVPQFAVLDDLITYDYQTAVYAFGVFPTLDERPFWHSAYIDTDFGLNLTRYQSPDIDRWLDEANRLPGCDMDQRKQTYRQIEQQLLLDNPVFFLTIPQQALIHRNTIQGLLPGPFAPLTWNSQQWSVSP